MLRMILNPLLFPVWFRCQCSTFLRSFKEERSVSLFRILSIWLNTPSDWGIVGSGWLSITAFPVLQARQLLSSWRMLLKAHRRFELEQAVSCCRTTHRS